MARRPAPARHPRRAADPAGRLHQPTTTPAARTGPCRTGPTPATAYAARPKAAPGDRAADTHDRVRADRVDADGKLTLRHNGKLHHIGIGRTHARTRVLMLVHDLHIRVINAATGELLRELTLDPDRDYQPTGRPPGPPPGTGRKTRNPEP